jgi:hypothetical protein
MQIMGAPCNTPLNTTPAVLMLTALVLSFLRVFPDRGIPAIYCEGHGRNSNLSNKSFDTSRTIGWFTALFPLIISNIGTNACLEGVVVAVKDYYQDASEGAAGKFAAQVLGETSTSFQRADVELLFNFSGRLQRVTRDESPPTSGRWPFGSP